MQSTVSEEINSHREAGFFKIVVQPAQYSNDLRLISDARSLTITVIYKATSYLLRFTASMFSWYVNSNGIRFPQRLKALSACERH